MARHAISNPILADGGLVFVRCSSAGRAVAIGSRWAHVKQEKHTQANHQHHRAHSHRRPPTVPPFCHEDGS